MFDIFIIPITYRSWTSLYLFDEKGIIIYLFAYDNNITFRKTVILSVLHFFFYFLNIELLLRYYRRNNRSKKTKQFYVRVFTSEVHYSEMHISTYLSIYVVTWNADMCAIIVRLVCRYFWKKLVGIREIVAEFINKWPFFNI